MSHPITRRAFTLSLAAAGGSVFARPARSAQPLVMRQFHNQPPDSPLHRALADLWAAVRRDSDGRVDVRVFPENDKIDGGDLAAISMIMDGRLDFFTANGALIGTQVPAYNVQGIPYAFSSLERVFAALDGPLGEFLAGEARAKGLHAIPRGSFDNGFQQLTSRIGPIRTVADLQGLKVRTPSTPLYIETFNTLGAVAVPTTLNKMYETLKSGAADAQTDPLAFIELFKLYEVQKYVSITNHLWAGFNLFANLERWEGLPLDVRSLIEKTVPVYVQRQRQENQALNERLRKDLLARGMIFNEAETASFRARLAPLYAKWKGIVGPRAWELLEQAGGVTLG
jgi:tripartite ATP-independent transporter DctP family solute receptor